MVEALCDVGLFRHALHILRAAAPALVPERCVRVCWGVDCLCLWAVWLIFRGGVSAV